MFYWWEKFKLKWRYITKNHRMIELEGNLEKKYNWKLIQTPNLIVS